MDFAFSFVIDNGGLDNERDYKYVAEEEKCRVNKENRHVVTIDGYEDVPPNSEAALKQVGSGAAHAMPALPVHRSLLGRC